MKLNHVHLAGPDVLALIDLEGEAAAYHCEDPAGTRVEASWHASAD